MENFVSIYSLSDPNTGEIRYIGKADDIELRYMQHITRSKNFGCKRYSWLNSLAKKSLIPILELVDTVKESEWQFHEIQYILLFKSFGARLVNSTKGGDGNNSFKHSEKTKQKLREINLGSKKPEWVKEKMSRCSSKFWLGKKRPETGNKISEKLTGKLFTAEHKANLVKSAMGRIFSEETKVKIAKSNTGQKRSAEQKANIKAGIAKSKKS